MADVVLELDLKTLACTLLTLVSLAACFPDSEREGIPVPGISSITPAIGPVGTRVTISGHDFMQDGESTVVLLGALAIKPEQISPRWIEFIVPEDARKSNVYVKVGNRTSQSFSEFVVTGTYTGAWLQISAGGGHACAIREDTTLWCWGEDGTAQLGQGRQPTLGSREKIPLSVGKGWNAVSVPDYFIAGNTCAQSSNNEVFCWGDNYFGPLPKEAGHVVTAPTQLDGTWSDFQVGGFLACGTTANTLTCWSRAFTEPALQYLATPRSMGDTGAFARYTVGYAHACGIKSDGTLWCWGSNRVGELGIGSTEPRFAPVQVSTATDWLTVSAGGSVEDISDPGSKWYEAEFVPNGHTCGIRTNGSLWCWGWNHDGQLGIGNSTNAMIPTRVGIEDDWQFVDASNTRTCAIKTNHSLWCTGGQSKVLERVGTATDWATISAGELRCGLKVDGTVWCWDIDAREFKQVIEYVLPPKE